MKPSCNAHVTVNEIDSSIFGKRVLDIRNFDSSTDIAALEAGSILPLQPWYVCCKIPSSDCAGIHLLESAGFRYVETQLVLSFRVKSLYPSNPFPQYIFEEVCDHETLSRVIDIATSSIIDDRIANDPLLGPLYAGKRYGAYLARSMESPDQHLYALKNGQNGDIVGFKSHRYLPDGSVQLLLGGLRDDCKGSGLAPLLEHLEFSTLLAAGIKRGVTAVSARNLAIMNLEIAGFGFKVKESLVVLRKMYAT